MRGAAADAFPAAAGAGALPVMAWDDQAFREPGERRLAEEAAVAGVALAPLDAPPPPGAHGHAHGGPAAPPRTLAPPGITGLLQTAVEPPPDATLAQNRILFLVSLRSFEQRTELGIGSRRICEVARGQPTRGRAQLPRKKKGEPLSRSRGSVRYSTTAETWRRKNPR